MTDTPNSTNASAPILLFDSGLGGLTVFDATRHLLPTAPIVYVADYAGLPYGERSEAEIAARVPAMLGRLAERYQPSLICIACNTASTIALGAVRAALDLPIVGTVPAIKPAAAITQSRTIGLLGTSATIRQAYVDNLHAEFAADCRLIRHADARLVEAAEKTMRGGMVDDALFDDAIAGLVRQQGGQDIDVIVLACTHFPLLAEPLRAAAHRAGLTEKLQLIDGAEGIARRIAFRSAGKTWPAEAVSTFVVTAEPSERKSARPMLESRGFTRFESLQDDHREQ